MTPLSDFVVIVGVLLLIQIVLFPALRWWLEWRGWWPETEAERARRRDVQRYTETFMVPRAGRVTVWRQTTAAEYAQEFDLAIGKLRCIQRMSVEDIERLIADARRAGETTTLTPLQALDRTIENQIRKLVADERP